MSNRGMPSSKKAMTADAGMVDHRAVGHSVSGRKNSQITRKREVCLCSTLTSSCERSNEPLLRKGLMLRLPGMSADKSQTITPLNIVHWYIISAQLAKHMT